MEPGAAASVAHWPTNEVKRRLVVSTATFWVIGLVEVLNNRSTSFSVSGSKRETANRQGFCDEARTICRRGATRRIPAHLRKRTIKRVRAGDGVEVFLSGGSWRCRAACVVVAGDRWRTCPRVRPGRRHRLQNPCSSPNKWSGHHEAAGASACPIRPCSAPLSWRWAGHGGRTWKAAGIVIAEKGRQLLGFGRSALVEASVAKKSPLPGLGALSPASVEAPPPESEGSTADSRRPGVHASVPVSIGPDRPAK